MPLQTQYSSPATISRPQMEQRTTAETERFFVLKQIPPKKKYENEKKLLTNRLCSAKIILAVGTAGVAQLVEQLICNQQVGGSNPSTSSTILYGGIPERPNGADCKSVVTDFGGSNPPSPTNRTQTKSAFDFFMSAVFAAGFQRVDRRKRNRMTCMERPAARLLAALLSMWLLLIARTSSLSTR